MDRGDAMADEADRVMERSNELVLEIEQFFYADSCKLILVSTGKLAKVFPQDVVQHFID